ncbi:MAG: transposase [Polaribacter sp.]|nr:transposase [Polaribacter sp.]
MSIHYQNILKYFDNRSTDASVESFNEKTKDFRAQIRGDRSINISSFLGLLMFFYLILKFHNFWTWSFIMLSKVYLEKDKYMLLAT